MPRTQLANERPLDDRWNGPAGGCLELMRAVLEDAIGCAQGTARRFQRDDRRALQADAVRWMRSDRMSDPFDYRRICEALGVDPEDVRRRVLSRASVLLPERRAEAPRRYTIRDDLVALVNVGIPVKRIAEQAGLAPGRVSLLTAAATRTRKARRDSDILARRAEGWTLDRLADSFGLSRTRIVRILGRARRAAAAERAVA